MQSYWSEVKCNYVDDESICYIDAWKEGEEQGQTIAWVDMLSGRIIYGCPEAHMDILAQEAIAKSVNKAKEAHPYSVNRMEKILMDIVDSECEGIGSGVNVRENLLCMGFKEEEMLFFGFPLYLD